MFISKLARLRQRNQYMIMSTKDACSLPSYSICWPSKVNFLKVNSSKSELLVICGNFKRTASAGINFKENAKYLGVRYNKQVDVKRALNEFKPKTNFIFSRHFRLLKKSDCRTRYNLWQIFILPLLRMAISIIGVAESHRCREQMQLIKTEMRRTLKKFLLLPRSSPVEIVDNMTNYNEAFIVELIKRWEDLSRGRIKTFRDLEPLEFSEFTCTAWEEEDSIRSFNPELNGIMMILNQYYCKGHSERTITIDHLKEHGIDMDYYYLRGKKNQENRYRQKYKEIWDLLNNLKGEKKYQKKQEARPAPGQGN